jgi:hypothetical protein
LAGCHPASPVTPPPAPLQECADSAACSPLLVNPCGGSGHSWDLIQFGSPQDDIGVVVGSDDGCNVYVAGTTRGIIDPLDQTPPLMQDIFVARVPSVSPDDTNSPSGDWMRRIVSSGDDLIKDLVVSGAGDTYLVGSTACCPGRRI